MTERSAEVIRSTVNLVFEMVSGDRLHCGLAVPALGRYLQSAYE
jgi:hypothetical protein